ncbi:Tetraketide alpha-pyrone reductase 2 [Colletotrichum chlorophyti]|uniref:Tetraketide alpha-pyrone reductase 2 n=1 Tax=Colletotrichum chlorophyti TaxID=708187 RepID=A0A1Q8S3Y1_9PEZI|nr:Tetraketide alpha-pyrone reductase 2 [Colletotrichum chlorophyti]
MSTYHVTSRTGFLGLYVVKLLLEHGHHVNIIVCNLKNTARCKPLLDLQAHFMGQLALFEADLVKPMSGCQVVYHVASPFLLPVQIKDCSVTQYPYIYSKMVAEREAWKFHDAQNRWSLVVINPGLVIGPPLTPESASGSL